MEYEIEVYEEIDTIYYRLEGSLSSKEDAEEVGEEIFDIVRSKLPDKWYAINDMRDLGVVGREASELIDRNQQKLDDMGAQAVVRITDESTQSVTKMSFEVGSDYEYDVYETRTVPSAKQKIKELRFSN